MEFKGLFVLLAITITICCVQGYPRDSTVVKAEEVNRINEESVESELPQNYVSEVSKVSTDEKPSKQVVDIRTGPVSCDFEEATEDIVCQKHCLPKGYFYGLCVGHKCSCI